MTPLLLYHEAPAVRERALRALGAEAAESGRRRSAGRCRIPIAASGRRRSARSASSRTKMPSRLRGLCCRTAIRASARPRPWRSPPALKRGRCRCSRKPRSSDVVSDSPASVARGARRCRRGARRDQRRSFQRLLIPLLHDQAPEVADARDGERPQGRAVRLHLRPRAGLPAAQPALEGAARETLVGYGEAVIDALAYFMDDEQRGHLAPPAHPQHPRR